MATVNWQVLPTQFDTRICVVQWPAMLNGDIGQPFDSVPSADKSVQMIGVPGAGFIGHIQGSLHPITPAWARLRDAQQNLIAFVVADVGVIGAVGGVIQTILDHTNLIRPAIVAGDGNTSVTVILHMVVPT